MIWLYALQFALALVLVRWLVWGRYLGLNGGSTTSTAASNLKCNTQQRQVCR